jgi:hypothetical protein
MECVIDARLRMSVKALPRARSAWRRFARAQNSRIGSGKIPDLRTPLFVP